MLFVQQTAEKALKALLVNGLGKAIKSAREGNLDALRNGVVVYGHLTPELEAFRSLTRRTA